MAFNRFTLPFVFANDGQGLPLENAYLIFFETDQTTQQTTYADKDLTTPSTTVAITYGGGTKNAVQADAAGRFPTIFLTPEAEYYVVLLDEDLNVIKTENYISVPATESGFASGVFEDIGGAFYPARDIIDVTTTTYTLTSSTSWGRIINCANANTVTITVPAPTASTFQAGWFTDIQNRGAGDLVITSTANIDGSSNDITLKRGQGLRLGTDNTNYYTSCSTRQESFANTGGELTISSGSVTAAQATYYTIDTESDAASDDLDTIGGSIDGKLIIISAANAARTVVVKHNTGNIYNPELVDISLDNIYANLIMRYDSTLSKWVILNKVRKQTFESSNQAITAAGLLTVAHGLEKRPRYCWAELECVTANNNWAVGDRTVAHLNSSTAATDRLNSMYWDDTNIYLRISAAANSFTLADKTAGTSFAITNAQWELILHAEL